MIKCQNCVSWCEAEQLTKTDRRCLNGGTVQANSKKCRYFNPVFFHCEKFNQRLTYNQCLARRRNDKNLAGYSDCKKCRQFDQEIREIIEEYWLDMRRIVNPRNRESNDESLGSGKIKRRDKGNQTRKLKRRDKQPPEVKTRKLKRRSNPKPPKKNDSDPGPEYTVCPKCNQKAMRENYCRVCAYRPDLEMTPKMKAIKEQYLNEKAPTRKLKRRRTKTETSPVKVTKKKLKRRSK